MKYFIGAFVFMAVPLLAAVIDRQCDYGDSIARRERRAKRKMCRIANDVFYVEVALLFGANCSAVARKDFMFSGLAFHTRLSISITPM